MGIGDDGKDLLFVSASFFFFFFESAFVYRNSYLVQGQDAVPYFRTKIR